MGLVPTSRRTQTMRSAREFRGIWKENIYYTMGTNKRAKCVEEPPVTVVESIMMTTGIYEAEYLLSFFLFCSFKQKMI